MQKYRPRYVTIPGKERRIRVQHRYYTYIYIYRHTSTHTHLASESRPGLAKGNPRTHSIGSPAGLDPP